MVGTIQIPTQKAGTMALRSLSSYRYMGDDEDWGSNDDDGPTTPSTATVAVRRPSITKLLMEEMGYPGSLPINDNISWKPPKKSHTNVDWKNPTTYTTWDSRDSWIWETSFDAPGTEEIVFDNFDDDVTRTEQDEDESDDEFYDCLETKGNKEFKDDAASKSSDETTDTEDETVPYCSSPELQHHDRCHRHRDEEKEDRDDILHGNDLISPGSPLSSVELSPIPADPLQFLNSVDSDGSDNYFFQDDPGDCDLIACITDLRDRFQLHHSHNNQLAASSGADRSDEDDDDEPSVFLVEESRGTVAQMDRDNNRPVVLYDRLEGKSQMHRCVRFADEVEGAEMETVYVVEHPEEEETAYKQVLVLLLLPRANKFEFVHAEYSTEARILVGTLLHQLPQLASKPEFARERYFQLVRATVHGEKRSYVELINALSIHDYDLQEDEVLVAVAAGYRAKTMMVMAKTLIGNDAILRAVKRSKRWGRTLQRVKSDEEVSRDAHEERRSSWFLESDAAYDGDDDHGRDGQDSYDSADSLEIVHPPPQPQPNIALTGFEVQTNVHILIAADHSHNRIDIPTSQERNVTDVTERQGQEEARCVVVHDCLVVQDDREEEYTAYVQKVEETPCIPDRNAQDDGDDQTRPLVSSSSYGSPSLSEPKSPSPKSKAHRILSGIRPGKLIGDAIANMQSQSGLSPKKKSGRGSGSFDFDDDHMTRKAQSSWTSRFAQKRWKPTLAFRGKRGTAEF